MGDQIEEHIKRQLSDILDARRQTKIVGSNEGEPITIENVAVAVSPLVLARLPQGVGFLSNRTCPTGYSSVEDGYIKLGSKNLTLRATGSNQRNISHNHNAGNLHAAIAFDPANAFTDAPTIENRQSGDPFQSSHALTLRVGKGSLGEKEKSFKEYCSWGHNGEKKSAI